MSGTSETLARAGIFFVDFLCGCEGDFLTIEVILSCLQYLNELGVLNVWHERDARASGG